MKSSTRSRRKHEPLPKFPISLILEHLVPEGADCLDGRLSGWTRIRCPFHEDRTPSASINTDPEVQAFTCFSCERRGDGLKLLQSELGLSFIEALELARHISGWGEMVEPPRKKRRASEILGNV